MCKLICWKLANGLSKAFSWITIVIVGAVYTIGSAIGGTADYVKEVKKVKEQVDNSN